MLRAFSRRLGASLAGGTSLWSGALNSNASSCGLPRELVHGAVQLGGVRFMAPNRPSFNALVNSKKYRFWGVKPWRKKPKAKAMEGKPFREGIVQKVFIENPKKPNSANRKVCRVKLKNNKVVKAFIPGEGHNLFEHSTVLIRGGRTQDLIGYRLKVVRGARDCKGVAGRTTSRSIYGTKKAKPAK